MINLYEVKHIPKLKIETEYYFPYHSFVQTTFDGMFFVVGRTNCGGRHYSKSINNYNIAIKMYNDYCDMVSYFGGGTVELYSITEDGCDILFQKVI